MGRTYAGLLNLMLLLPVLGACSSSAGQTPEEAAGPREVVIRTFDYQFEAPDTILSGPTRIRLINEGPDFHHVWLVRLEEGKTLGDLMEHMNGGYGHTPEWAVDVGGPNTPGAPGEETVATLDLEPGDYAMLCVIPAPGGEVHIMKGMVRPLTVVPATGAPAAMPEADVAMTLDDYGFEMDGAIEPGRRTIRVRNVAAQAHEVVVKLEPGKTAADFLQFLGTREGPPPGKMIGGVTWLDQGESNLMTMDFEPGTYALLCFVPDAGDGKPHFMHGMVREFRVG